MELASFIRTGTAEGWLKTTSDTHTINIDGRNEPQPVYEVRIDKLRYNTQNGRIATYMSRYRDEHGDLPSDTGEINTIIEKMICDSDPKHMAGTKLDIKAKGQQEVAIILSDGTVIDGNRRFTCLRQLEREEHATRFLRCFIFPDTYSPKAIKLLELDVQMGKDEKVAYDTISRLVDIKRYVCGGLVSREEYAKHAGMTKHAMTKVLNQIEVIDDFLESIDAPGAYHIAQDLKLQGPIESLASKLSTRCKNEDEREDLKAVVFANLLMADAGDRTRDLRDLMDKFIESNQRGGEFASQQLDIAERVYERLEDRPDDAPMSTDFIRDYVAADKDLRYEQEVSYERARMKSDNRKIKISQAESVASALDNLDNIEIQLLPKLEDVLLGEMRDGLENIQERAATLLEAVRSEINKRG